MKVIKFLCGRVFLTGLLIFIQLAWFLLFWLRLTEYAPIMGGLFTVLSLLIVLYIISNDQNPSFKIGWIIIIMAIPLLGGLLYLFFGSKHPLRKISDKISAQHNLLSSHLPPNNAVQEKVEQLDMRVAGSTAYLQNIGDYPVWDNSHTVYYPLGDEMYKAMLAELEKAEKFIFMEYFIVEKGIMWDGIYEILKRKAKAGVDVRLIYDDMGCLMLLPKNFDKELERDGIKCMKFNPFVPLLSLAMNNRDHRKILLVDGKVAFNGGINIADEYINVKVVYGHWKDTGVKIVGDAVWSFTVMFLEMWNAFRKTDENIEQFKVINADVKQSSGFVLPYGDSPLDDEAVSQNLYMDILARAKRYVYIFTPYLIIDDEMKNALCFAAKRGVDVRLVTPGIPDKEIVYRMTRSYYKPLLSSGVKIYEYSPGFLHAKSYVSDDEVAVVGTINMDFRSLYLHFECGTYMYKTESVMQLKNDFLDTLEKCREVKPQDLKQGFLWGLFDSVVRVFSPLM